MKISQEDEILIKNLSKQYGARRLLSELPDKGWKLASIDSLLKKICRTGTLSGNHAAVDRVHRGTVDDLVLSQKDKPKRPHSAREISHETAILRSSVVHRIIHRDLQLKCFKRCPPVWLLCETNRISHLTR